MKDTIAARFPDDFVWGAATASYQIEGAIAEDGRAPSVWDAFSLTPGRVENGDTGDIACDFYHRYPEDVQLMKRLGLDAFRFSIAWPRVIPQGRGAVNEQGLDFYDRLVDELLANDITPFPTLFHWDLPQALEEEGGWTVRPTIDAFCEYVEAVVGRLGDRVENWATHNEPWVHAWLGYGSGTWGPEMHAPGRTSRREGAAAAHHLMVAHGRAIEIMRREMPDAKLGVVLNMTPAVPATDSEADRRAAQLSDGQANRWFLDAVFKGSYPQDVVDEIGADMPEIHEGDMELISAPLDWLGVNHYFQVVCRRSENGEGDDIVMDQDKQYTAMGFPWEVNADAFYDLLTRIQREYDPPCMFITENGAAFYDYQQHDGSVKDPERVAFLEGYIDAVGRAIEDGAQIKGYFVWSLLDNFEWARGYSRRFGIVYVDYRTLERTPKSSALWYSELIAAHRERARSAGLALDA
jgi:beta-glucosidase